MFFGLTIEKLLLIGLVAGLLIGPERLPRYVESLTRFAKRAKEYVTTAKTRVKDEMGSDFDDVDWRTLDPRQYDPRRIVREALMDDPAQEVADEPDKPQSGVMAPVPQPFHDPAKPTPWDADAT